MSRIRVLIADSSDIFQEGVHSILASSNLFEMAGRVETADKVYPRIQHLRPDICLISLSLKGLDPAALLKKIRDGTLATRILLVSEPSDFPELTELVRAGAAGGITRTIEKRVLLHLLQRAANGECVFSKEITKYNKRHYAGAIGQPGNGRKKPANAITRREHEILQLIVEGYTSQEIASTLYISPRTVETHRSNLLHKLGLKNTAGLVRFAMREELDSNS